MTESCSTCKPAKNPAAVALGKIGGTNWWRNLSPKARDLHIAKLTASRKKEKPTA